MNLPDVPLVCVDTETSGKHPDDGATVAVVSIAWRENGAVVSAAYPFDQGIRDKFPNDQLNLLDGEDPNLREDEWQALLGWLSRRHLVMHNAKFDLMMLKTGTRHWPGIDLTGQLRWDTMLANRELWPREMIGLDASCSRLGLGEKKNEIEIQTWLRKHKLPYRRYDLAPWELVEPYAAVDAELTMRLFTRQLTHIRELEGEEFRARIDRETRVTKTLLAVESRGVLYDVEKSLEAANLLEQRAAGLEAALPWQGGTTQAKDWFFRRQGAQPLRTSEKTGAASLDEVQIRELVKQGVPGAAEYDQLMRCRRAISMWYRGYPEKAGSDGRLRCTYRHGHVKSGRMSVERVQLQAIPKNDKALEGVPTIRSLIHAPEGRQLWNLDLSQAELRVAAKYARCDKMLAMLERGEDLHSITTQEVMGVSRDDPDWKAKRDIGKRLTFGSIFQIGGEKFQSTLVQLADIHLPLDECTRLVQRWRSMYPEFGVAYRRAEQKARLDGWVRLLPGSPMESQSWFGERDYPNTAWNRIVQGSLAELLKLWLVEAEHKHPGMIVLTVHDSLVLEIEEDAAQDVVREVAAIGADRGSELFKVEMKVDADTWEGK